MKLITAYIRPHKLEEVKSALALLPLSGLTVSDARGCGNNPESPSDFFGQQLVISLPIRSKIMVAVADSLLDEAVEAIVDAAATGNPGDGKIFVEELLDAVRVRTEERGGDVV